MKPGTRISTFVKIVLTAALTLPFCTGCQSLQAAFVRQMLKKRPLNMESYTQKMADTTDKGTIALPEKVKFPREVSDTRFQGMQVFRMEAADEEKPVVFYLHGGAYCNNFDKNHWKSLADISHRSGCGVVTPNYPLLPLHTAREAHGLVLGLYEDLLNQYPAGRIVLMGDSAGGGFALALAQEIRDAGIPMPAKMVLLSPFADAVGGDESLQDKDTWLHVDALRKYGMAWADGLDPHDPMVSPLYGDMTGLPQAFIFTGTWEVLYTDSVRTYEKLRDAGVDATLYKAEKFGHVYPLYPLPEGKKARTEIVRIITSNHAY